MAATGDRAGSAGQTETGERTRSTGFVYCKGCGAPLEDRARLQKPKAVIDAMMCEPCRKVHNHALMPSPGAPTFCYRCGHAEEVVMEPATTPITHHICPVCLPDRLTRYKAGDFVEPQKAPVGA